MEENLPKKIVNFYIDGFNFYFGLKRIIKNKPDWKKFYWLDIVKFCGEFLETDEELGLVTYFTARPNSKDKTKRQNILMNCNLSLNPKHFKIVYGRYAKKELICLANGGCHYRYDALEEKETDVNLAIQMIDDAYQKSCNKMVLISGDTDFVPPLKMIKNSHKNIETMILFPPGNYSAHLSQICRYNKQLEKFKPKWNRAKLDDIVKSNGKEYTIPAEWKI
jgi:uncharacterized LabA/DUF88 family protein